MRRETKKKIGTIVVNATAFALSLFIAITAVNVVKGQIQRNNELEALRIKIEALEKTINAAEEERKAMVKRITTYLESRGSIAAQQIAEASVEAGADPYLLAAIATLESNGNPWSPRGAHGEQGAWQVRSKFWGKVPADTIGQAVQAERVLRTLINQHGSVKAGVTAYNGQGEAARRYARIVMRIYREMQG